MSPNLKAFLDMIAFSELGAALLAESDDGYNVIVGSTPAHPILFSRYTDHPRRLMTMMIKGRTVQSTAAGRYQILARYFDAYKKQLGLPDFGHDSQDRIAVQLIGECRAMPLILAGRFDAAVAACSSRWASLPGNRDDQHQNGLAALHTAYLASGGVTC